MSADEWVNGANNELNLMKLDPSLRDDQEVVTTFVAKKSYADLEKENKKLKKRLAELEARLGISSQDDGNGNGSNGSNGDAGATDEKNDDADATMATTASEDAGTADVDADADDAPNGAAGGDNDAPDDDA